MPRTALLAATALLIATAVPATLLAPADAKPAMKPRLSATVKPVTESGKAAVLELRLSAKAKKTVKIGWKTVDGTAKAGSDYTTKRSTITIKKGKRTAKVTVPILEDAVHEATETFGVRLSSRQAKVPAKPVTLTLTDNDPAEQTAPPAPTALVGTVTVTQTIKAISLGSWTLTMKLRLVPTATSGEWRDDGTGSWTMSGSGTGMTLPPCPSSTYTLAGSGRFLPSAGEPTTGKTALVLSGFDPATAAGVPALSWHGKTGATDTSYAPDVFEPETCTSSTTTDERDFGVPAPGPAGSYSGTTGPTRGVTFGYESTDGFAILKVTGTLTPVS